MAGNDLESALSSLLSNPEELGRLSRIAQQLMGGGEAAAGETPSPAAPPAPEEAASPGLGKLLGGLFSGGGSGGGGAGLNAGSSELLIKALRPYIGDERRRKLDRAVLIAKAARVAGLVFRQYGEGEDGGV